MKYGFIGAGNISSAVITGAVSSIYPKDIFISDTDAQKCKKLAAATGVCVCPAEEIINSAEVIFFGLKPNVLLGEISRHAPVLTQRSDVFVVSFAAGISLERLCELIPDVRVARALPNLNAAVGAGMTAFCANTEEVSAVMDFMSACGEIIPLDEKLFDLCTILSGSTPAFTYMYIDALARAALSLGMGKREALRIAAQSVLGSAKMLLETEEHPWELVDRVCSPGGLTIEGVRELQENAFEGIVMRAVERAVLRIKP